MKTKFILSGVGILIVCAFIISASNRGMAAPTQEEIDKARIATIDVQLAENSGKYQELSPLAANSRTECVLLDSREAQMKYLNAQSNKLREERAELEHRLKILSPLE